MAPLSVIRPAAARLSATVSRISPAVSQNRGYATAAKPGGKEKDGGKGAAMKTTSEFYTSSLNAPCSFIYRPKFQEKERSKPRTRREEGPEIRCPCYSFSSRPHMLIHRLNRSFSQCPKTSARTSTLTAVLSMS